MEKERSQEQPLTAEELAKFEELRNRLLAASSQNPETRKLLEELERDIEETKRKKLTELQKHYIDITVRVITFASLVFAIVVGVTAGREIFTNFLPDITDAVGALLGLVASAAAMGGLFLGKKDK